MKVSLWQDDIDRHGEGCDCGLCNANGKSYGVAIVPAGVRLEDYDGDPVDRVYGPSEDAAFHNAKLEAQSLGHEVVEPV